MNLFAEQVDADEQHPNYKNIIRPSMGAERAELSRWLEGFPDRDGKFVKEFQTTFNSSFWEIYLHAVFRTYGFVLDWSYAAPDFLVASEYGEFVVEATTANAAQGKVTEWQKTVPIGERVLQKKFWALNREAMIRLSNAILGKTRAYQNKYSTLEHVGRKPFVIAIAPFEQPDFQYQYDRPIRALLYDEYVDEDAYNVNPALYPDGPPSVRLGAVEKDNGAEIPLGIFNGDDYKEVSAIAFSCTATWGKVDALAKDSTNVGVVHVSRGGKPEGKPYGYAAMKGDYTETLEDGLQVFHNPNASYPLDPRVFRRPGVVQHYFDDAAGWVHEEVDNCLHSRVVQSFIFNGGAEGAVTEEIPDS
jgi:hypothetical protein